MNQRDSVRLDELEINVEVRENSLRLQSVNGCTPFARISLPRDNVTYYETIGRWLCDQIDAQSTDPAQMTARQIARKTPRAGVSRTGAREGNDLAKKRGRPRTVQGPENSGLRVRMSDEFLAWLGIFADECNLNKSATVTQALIEYARSKGFRRKPPKR